MVYEQRQKRGYLTELERAAVRMSVGALPDLEQRIVRETFWQRLSVSDIAHRLRTTPGRVKEILREALRQLRTTLELMFGFCFD